MSLILYVKNIMAMNQNEYLEKILSEIESAKSSGRKGLFKINEKVSDSNAIYIQKYFEGNEDYRIETRKCKNCRRTWDILIYFRKF